MSARSELLAARRRRLVAESQALRANLMHEIEPMAYTLSALDSGMRIFNRLRQHPEWVGAGVIALGLLKPRRVSSWLQGAVLGLRMWRQFSPVLRQLGIGKS